VKLFPEEYGTGVAGSWLRKRDVAGSDNDGDNSVVVVGVCNVNPVEGVIQLDSSTSVVVRMK